MKSLSTTSRKIIFLSVIILLFSYSSFAQVSVTSLAYTYSQNFDGLSNTGTNVTWTDNSTIPSWYASLKPNSTSNYGPATRYDTSSGYNLGPALVSLFSLGLDNATNRALGSRTAGNINFGSVYYGARFVNNSGQTITHIPIQYTGEEWDEADNSVIHQDSLVFSYQIGNAGTITNLTSGTWTAVDSLTFVTPVNSASLSSVAILNGTLGSNQITLSASISGISLAPGQEIWLRWQDIHGYKTATTSPLPYMMGIDNFYFNPNSANMGSAVTSYTISGNAGVAGATLSWTDTTAKTTTAAGDGSYSFVVSYNFTGTVTPSKAGYTFTPISKSYTNVLANQTSQNYTATAITYTISGNAGVGGATLSWTDTTAKTTTAAGDGSYSFVVSYNFTGTVTPSKAGYTFTPTNKSYTNVLANQTSQNYIATAITYTISGNAGVGGATISWTTTVPKSVKRKVTTGGSSTTTADSSGNYSFTVPYNWSGTVTPTKSGYTFSPVSKTYTNLISDTTNQNYTATPVTPTISGNAGVGGATLSWTDTTAKTTTAAGDGSYSFVVSYNFTGTVTPSKAGYTFTPTNKSYTNVLANQTSQNYTATAIGYTISGNAGVGGATLSWTDTTAKTATSAVDGSYSFVVSYNFSGTVTPSLTGYTFNPVITTYTNVLSNQTNQNYTAQVTISGNAGVGGATISWTTTSRNKSVKRKVTGDGGSTTTADGNGNYSFVVPIPWSGTVTPSLAGYTFSPVNRTYNNVTVNDTGQNYTATPITYTISGNAGVAGATLSWTDTTAKTTTAAGDGSYSITVSNGFNGIVTPTKTGYTFSPTSISYSGGVTSNETDQNYTATAVTPTISGNAGVGGATISWTIRSGKSVKRKVTTGGSSTTTADSSGNYSFTVPYGWSGTVTPSKAGYTFSPVSKTYTNLISDTTNQNYIATAVTYAISGNAGVAGATLSWTDTTAKTATAAGDGSYSFVVSYNFSGTVTPSKAGYTFTPDSTSYTNVLANKTNQNYTATPITYTISGNAGVAGAILSWTDGGLKTDTANGSGNYSFTVSYNFTGIVTPSKAGYTFTPDSTSYTNVLSNQTNQNYTAQVTISGNAGVGGAIMSWTTTSGNKSHLTNGSGNYSFVVPIPWSGTVTPSKTGYTFDPVKRTYTNVTANDTGQNYTATPITYTISGNAGVAGATLSWTDTTAKTTTAAGDGSYSITVSNGFNGIVTPTKTGYTFSPTSISYSGGVTSNETDQNYTATAVTPTISGNAGVGGATISWTIRSGKSVKRKVTTGGSSTTTADSSGNYSFTVPYGWSGTVTPSKAGYTFSPVSKTYTNLISDTTNQNYIATAVTYAISGNAGVAGATLSWTDTTAKTATAAGDGSYSFVVSYNFSGTVTPSKAGYTFTPDSTSYTNVLANKTNQNYTATPITYTISGNAGVAGAILSWTDGGLKTDTANGSGNYSFTVSYNFTGIVTPSKAGYTFTPDSTSYTNVLSNQTNQNYTAQVTISGNAGVGGAIMSWTTTSGNKSHLTNGSGNYSFVVPIPWSGTVTPSKTGYTFDPVKRTYTNVTANDTGQNYTATPIPYTISGNAGVGGATISWTDTTAKTTTAASDGSYSFVVPYNFSGKVTPSKAGYIFDPAFRNYKNVKANQTSQNYAATAATYAIWGNVGVAGATLSWTDTTAETVTAGGGGDYIFWVPYNWSGTVTPSLTGYTFTPDSTLYTNVLAIQRNQNYTALVTISGNAGVGGATISWTTTSGPKSVKRKVTGDGGSTTTADGSGNYSFVVPIPWSGTVTPSKTGYTFNPVNRTYTNITASDTGQNYTATPITYTISGNAGVAGAILSWTDGGLKTDTANGSGNYSFTVSYNFSGTVTPSKTGYTFTPDSTSYTNVLANKTNQNYTATPITYTISGNAGVAGAILSWTDTTVKTTTADGSGNYSFTVSYNWSGRVTPSLTGCTFSVEYTVYTNVLSNQTSQNYTAHVTISGNAGVAGATLSWTTTSNSKAVKWNVTRVPTTKADGNGNYSILVQIPWSGTVTPSMTGYTFNPVNRTYTNVTAKDTGQNYTATPITYTISGNAGTAGAILSWIVGTTTNTDTADGSGNYSFTVSYNSSVLVNVSKTGYRFNPPGNAYLNVRADQTNQNYTATAITYTISGNAGIAGATLSWTDTTAKTATADGSGNYTFTVSSIWSGTVTPSLTGYTFTPANTAYSNVQVNQTNQNYTAQVTISGNAGVGGATISWTTISGPKSVKRKTTGGGSTTTADGNGNYSFVVPIPWSGMVTPSKTGYTFTPVNRAYTNITANDTGQNYTALVAISGNAGIAGATLSWTDTTAKTTTADGSGNYSITIPYNWSGTVTPSLTGYTFAPVNKTYTNVPANQVNQNYQVIITISGNAGTPGATISWIDGTTKTTTADSSGNYSFTVFSSWTGTVTPSKPGFAFTPGSKFYAGVFVNQSKQNFTASATTLTISGNAGVVKAVLNWTDGTVKTDTADVNGNYTFSVSYNWTGSVTVSKAGFTFKPPSRTYTNLIANQINQNYAASAITFTISGNAAVGGAILSWTDGTAKGDTSDVSGNYSFVVSYNWSGPVTISKTGFTFSPPSRTYTDVLANQTNQNYSASAITFTVSGNSGVGGAVLSWTDGAVKTDTADTGGNYSFTVSYNWSGNVTPSKNGYTFTPVNRIYTNVMANQVNQNYSVSVISFTISGNTVLDNVTLSWIDGTSKTTVSDSSGNYSFTVSYNWTGTVTPSKNGFSFDPLNKAYSNVISNQLNQNYSAFFKNAPFANAAVQVKDSSFTANWNKVTGAQGYRLDVAIDSNFTNILFHYNNKDVDTNSTYSITGLISGTIFYYRVRAYYRTLFTDNSNTVAVSTLLNTPTNLTAVYDSAGILLSWSYDFSNSDVRGFIIFREGGPNSGNSKLHKIVSLTPIDTSNGTSTTYLDKNVVEGYVYSYSISAYDLSGIISTIGGSGSVSVPILIPLEAPVNLTGIAKPGGKIVLFWKNRAATEDGSIIQRSPGDSTNFSLLGKTSANDTTYTDSTAQKGLKYYYRVAAYRDTISSVYSDTISIMNPLTGIADLLIGAPKEYKLYQNYPNPFNPTTQIRFALPKQSHVNITIFNILGAMVERLYDGELNTGYHEISFNGGKLGSGVYIYRIIAGSYSQVLKMVMVK